MKYLIIQFFLLIVLFTASYAREVGQTEITTEDGIEVFQDEKYYLLKKNVEIKSDEFDLNGQIVKMYFENDLYDIKKILASKQVTFFSDEFMIKGSGENVEFNLNDETILVHGKNSKLYLEETEMFSDGKINVNNSKSSFLIEGLNSKLVSENIYIVGKIINGNFKVIEGKREIENLFVEDNDRLNIKTDDIIMFSKKAVYKEKDSTIELFDDVEVIRGNEIITGDYGILDTKKNSYKVKTKNSKKVKAVILNANE